MNSEAVIPILAAHPEAFSQYQFHAQDSNSLISAATASSLQFLHRLVSSPTPCR